MDLTKLTWEKYIDTYMMGIRQFVLKDDFSSLPAARNKLNK
jgi:fatty acyl-CoA reductase